MSKRSLWARLFGPRDVAPPPADNDVMAALRSALDELHAAQDSAAAMLGAQASKVRPRVSAAQYDDKIGLEVPDALGRITVVRMSVDSARRLAARLKAIVDHMEVN